MMRRLLIALTALVLIGGVGGAAMAQQDTNAAKPTAKDNPNPPDQEPGCNPSDQTPKKCPGQPAPCADAGGDTDGDGVCNNTDNCPGVANPDQADSDHDGTGDACEPAPCANEGGDTDGDGDCNDHDNCPDVANPDQADTDGDGTGDACEPAPCADAGGDTDGDGVCNNTDNCPDVANADQADTDDDGTGDACETTVAGTCTAGGLGIISKFEAQDPGDPGDETLAYAILGTDTEKGPLSKELHDQLEPNLGPAQPVGHEVICVVATIDNNAAS